MWPARQKGHHVQLQDQTGGHQQAFKISTRLALWTFAWLITLALARFGPAHLWNDQAAASWAAIIVNIVVGIGLIVAHARYLQDLDELQRKILMDAMAVTLGAGLVAGCAYGAAASANLIAGHADIALFIMVIGVVYVIASMIGTMRYR
jgi:hypothetical protein